MATPLWKVEVRFDGTNWVDVSGWALLPQGISIQRGRDSETGDAISVGTCSFTLENNDGRFTADRALSPYYPYVVEGVACQVSAFVNGSYRVRFYGTVQSWATSWTDDTGLHAQTAVTVTDTLGDLPDYTFQQAADEVVRRSAGVLYHWPLRETSEPLLSTVGVAALATNGKDGLGLGSPLLAMEEGEGNHPQFISGSNGLQLVARGLSVVPPWRVRLVIMSQPTASCELLELELPGIADRIFIKWHSVNGFSDGGVDSLGNPPSWPAVAEIGTDGGWWRLRIGGVAGSLDTAYVGTRISKITINPTLSGGSIWSASHLVVLQGASSAADLDAFTQQITSQRVTTFATAPEVVLGWAGGPTISGIPASATTLPPLEGRDSADVMGALVTGMGARLVDNMDGTLTWLPFSPSGAPVSLPSGEIDPSMTWQVDSTASYTDATVNWTNNTTYTSSRTARKRRSTSFEGVHAMPTGDRGMADWLVNSPTPARFPQAPYDLMTLSESQRQTLCSVTVGSRVSIPGMPSQMPSSTVVSIVEGIEESASDTEWTATFKLSPDVYSRLFVLDDATRGVLDSAYLLAP